MAKTTIIFMGTPEFAVPSLLTLAENYTVLTVVTQPDRRAGRGKRIQALSCKIGAEHLQRLCRSLEDIRAADFVATVAALNPILL